MNGRNRHMRGYFELYRKLHRPTNNPIIACTNRNQRYDECTNQDVDYAITMHEMQGKRLTPPGHIMKQMDEGQNVTQRSQGRAP